MLKKESFSEEGEEDDFFEELPDVLPNLGKQFRQSVSAEVYGQFNHRNSKFVARKFAKTETVLNQIRLYMNQSFLFNSLDDNERTTIEHAFEPIDFKQGQNVISEGDDGDYVYAVYSGHLSCYKNQTVVKNYSAGDVFGELALLYNAPRAATIVCDDDALLYRLDRETFNFIVKDSTVKKRETYE